MSWLESSCKGYSTADEINFLRGLRRKPAAFRKYASIVLSGRRQYDANIRVSEVRAAIVEMLAQPTRVRLVA